MSRLIVAFAALVAVVSIAEAQDAPPPAAAKGKREACRADITGKGLRGMDRLDAMQLCMAEGRLDCVKQAVSQKVARGDRKGFIQKCMGVAAAKAKPDPKADDDQQ